MGTTTNNGWPYPESTDYVADGATAIENLADAIDADIKYATFTTSVDQGGGAASSTLYFQYQQVDEWVFCQARIQMTGSGVGNNPIRVDVPVGIDQTVSALGTGRILDAGTRYDTVQVFAYDINTVEFVLTEKNTTQPYGQDPNMALAAGDEIWFQIAYRRDV